MRTLDEIAFDDGNCRGCHGIPESQGGYGHDSDCWFRAALSEAVAEERKALREYLTKTICGQYCGHSRHDGMRDVLKWLDAREERPREGKPAQEQGGGR